MEIVNYTPPASWTDKGMNWDNPDPLNFDYWMAILEAAKERAPLAFSITGFGSSTKGQFANYIPGKPMSTSMIYSLQEFIIAVAISQDAYSYLNIVDLPDNYESGLGGLWPYFPAYPFGYPDGTSAYYYAKNEFGKIAFKLNDSTKAADFSFDNAKEWLIAAKLFLQKLRYRRTAYSYSGGYSKSVSYSKSYPAGTYDEIKNELITRFNNESWSTSSNVYPSIYAEFYNNYDQNDNLISSYGQVSVNIPKYTLAIEKDADIICYMRLIDQGYNYNNHNLEFSPWQTFPDDNIIKGITCKVTLPELSGKVIDLFSIMSDFPLYPSLSNMPPHEVGGIDEIVSGFMNSSDQRYYPLFIADYSKNFNFK